MCGFATYAGLKPEPANVADMTTKQHAISNARAAKGDATHNGDRPIWSGVSAA